MAALDLALRLVLVALLLRPVGGAWLGPAFLVAAAAGLLARPVLRHPALWWALATLAVLRIAKDWPLADNHAYLLVYWCLAAALALRAIDPARTLATNGRLLVGLVFAFAALWKLALSPDFVSGDFMRFTWLTDGRFEGAALRAGLDPETLEANRAFLAGARDAPPALVEPPALRVAARLATFWTLVLEPAIAVAFLVPAAGALARLRDGLLLLFCATTYVLAPVAGFAWLLLSMGIAQSASAARRGAFVVVAGLVLIARELHPVLLPGLR